MTTSTLGEDTEPTKVCCGIFSSWSSLAHTHSKALQFGALIEFGAGYEKMMEICHVLSKLVNHKAKDFMKNVNEN